MDYLPKRHILLSGPPKCGKSISLSTVPKGSSLYYLDADHQAGGLVKEWKRRHGNLKNLEVVRVPQVRDDSEAERKTAFQAIRKLLWNPPSGFDFYSIDSYTRIVLNLTHSICGKGERHYNQFNNQQLSSAANDFWFQFINRVEYLEPSAWTITIMHEKWEELDDGTSDLKDSKSKMNLPQMIVPKCGTSAETNIPGNVDFIWHVEKGRRLVGGKSRSVSLFRTKGTSTIMAASVGFDDVLDETEVADFEAIFKKLNLPEVQRKKVPPKKEAKVNSTKGKGKWQK